MTNKNIYRSLGGLDPELVAKAAPAEKVQKKKKNAWVKRVSVAACISLIVIGGFFGNLFRSPDTPDVPENNIMSYFAITAYAANGESTELNVTSSFISSGTPKYNIFGHDMPLFCFDVKPSDLKSNEAVYQRFDISISYNGTTVTVADKDEHISIAYLASVHSPQTYGYSIFGWFTEPTDIIIHIVDKDSREIVEMITVNVKYLADKQEYELELTNLTTKFSEQKEAVDAHN